MFDKGLLRPVHTKNDNYKDNYNSKNASVHTSRRYYKAL